MRKNYDTLRKKTMTNLVEKGIDLEISGFRLERL